MSRTGDWVIAEQERLAGQYTAEEIEGWRMDSYRLDYALKALRRIASDNEPEEYAANIAIEVLAWLEVKGSPADPENLPGHLYATDSEYRRHYVGTTRAQSE